MELQENYEEIRALGAEVLAVSVDADQDARAIVEQLSLSYPVLYDTRTEVSRAWGVFNLLGDGVSAPATYVFDAAGELVAYHIGQTISDRPTAEQILDALASS